MSFAPDRCCSLRDSAFAKKSRRLAPRYNRIMAFAWKRHPFLAPLVLIAAIAGCHRAPALDVLPMINAGMDYAAISRLKGMNLTQAEVPQVAEMHEAGLSDSGCVQIFSAYRARKAPFDAGHTVAGLLRAGLTETSVLELSKLNELGRDAGELQAMRLAGLSDAIVLQVARRRADDAPVLSGASLARLKNTGLRASTLLELARRGIPDSDARAIISYRRRGASDSAVLKRFSGA